MAKSSMKEVRTNETSYNDYSSRPSIMEKIVPVLLVLSIGMAFTVGILWEKVSSLQKGGGTTTTGAGQQQAAQPQPTTVTLDQIKGLFAKDLIKFGDEKKKLLFVEVADPSCPFCAVAAGKNAGLNSQMGAQFKLKSDGGSYIPPVEEMKKLVDSGKASYVYIYYPGHGNGQMGMKALYCAQEKGKFWQAHDLIMSSAGYDLMNTTVKNDKTQSQTVANFLKGVVDPNFLKSCLDSGKYDERLTSDQSLATSLGVQGTPGFFVNSTSFPGAYNYTDMKSVVDAALK